MSDPVVVRGLLTSAGFADVQLRDLREPMYFGRDVEDACEFVSAQFGGMLNGLDEDERARALDALRSDMSDHHSSRGVCYDSAAWLIEARLP
ncbi:hypothetical protein [Amycolatopsis marina]|uniref:hypothetical protein n=1 Tax=Amycolatopsis marina TaxID=490629 RepID=UPI001FE71E42|nr:hypothetical protein [Amycolatopsis marina]